MGKPASDENLRRPSGRRILLWGRPPSEGAVSRVGSVRGRPRTDDGSSPSPVIDAVDVLRRPALSVRPGERLDARSRGIHSRRPRTEPRRRGRGTGRRFDDGSLPGALPSPSARRARRERMCRADRLISARRKDRGERLAPLDRVDRGRRELRSAPHAPSGAGHRWHCPDSARPERPQPLPARRLPPSRPPPKRRRDGRRRPSVPSRHSVPIGDRGRRRITRRGRRPSPGRPTASASRRRRR